MRGSSVHFKRISSAIHAVSHASREVPPEYLLPPELSLGTHVVIDDHGQVKKLLEHKMHLASRQAKATKDYSPMWEGVINLPTPSASVTPQKQIEIVKAWCVEYEKMTGHKVIRADVHLDEGYIDATGHAQYNAHAHVMCDRTDDKGKVMKLTSTVLREVQNMTAEVTTLARGLDARETHRRHVGHQNFRFDAEKNRVQLDVVKTKANTEIDRVRQLGLKWSKEDAAKLKKVQDVADKVPQLEATISTQAQQIEQLKAHIEEQYRLNRQALKDSGTASQKDYQALKKEKEAELAAVLTKLASTEAELTETKTKVETMTTENAKLQAQLDTKTEADKARFAAMGTAYEDHVAIGKDPALFVPGTPTKATKTPAEAPKAKTPPIPAPQPEKTLETVFPRLTEAEFREVPKQKLSDRVVDAAKDVLVWGVGLAEAAAKQKIFPPSLVKALEKLLANYIAPEPPPIQTTPAKPVTPAPTKAPGRGVGR